MGSELPVTGGIEWVSSVKYSFGRYPIRFSSSLEDGSARFSPSSILALGFVPVIQPFTNASTVREGAHVGRMF